MRINSVNILGSLKQPFKIVHLLTLFMFLQSNNTNKKKKKNIVHLFIILDYRESNAFK